MSAAGIVVILKRDVLDSINSKATKIFSQFTPTCQYTARLEKTDADWPDDSLRLVAFWVEVNN